MAPELEAFFDAIAPLAEAVAAGRVPRETATMAVAGAVVVMGIRLDDVRSEIAPLQRRRAMVAATRLIDEALRKGSLS